MPSLHTSLVALVALATVGFTPLTLAHPGESHDALLAEVAKRDIYMRDQTHLRKRCASQFAARGHEEAAAVRRRALVDRLREERGIAVERESLCYPSGRGGWSCVRVLPFLCDCELTFLLDAAGHYHKRSLVSVLATDHNETLADPDVDLSTSQDDVCVPVVSLVFGLETLGPC